MPQYLKLVCVVGLFLSIAGCKSQLKEFASAEGRFKVMLPGTPEEQSRTTSNVVTKLYAIEDREGAYVVGFADLPAGIVPSDDKISDLLKKARDGSLRKINATLTKDTSITLAGKYPGRELEGDIPSKDFVLRARIYYVDGRIYHILAVGTKSWANSADATTVLNSLTITN